MGYIEETGAAQFLRDARIAPIYEGTNGIQAIDLVTRKLPLGDGKPVRVYIAELRDVADRVAASKRPAFGLTAERLFDPLGSLEEATLWLHDTLATGRTAEALSGATPYLRLFGLAAGGAYLAEGALAVEEIERANLCRCFAENLLAEASALCAQVVNGAESIVAAGAKLREQRAGWQVPVPEHSV